MTLRREAFLDHVRECGEYEWVGTKRRWSLSADVAEAAAVREVAADCPGTAVAYEPVP
ncbi:hypothetical protein [Streptomyces parvulus]|uniref:Ferredoxin n=1 Tax=Streptomyces parvulus TaxID=146923 RepID=A0ABV5DMS5_9ACTN|nr:hypothetical protein [Streptomyces parvulus]